MFENDSIQSFQRSIPTRSKMKGCTAAAKQNKDDFIMDTNNSSIVSKRSVEKLYWTGQPEFFRFFVSRFKRRSPLINRGYWLRMRAIESTVERFLREPSDKHKVVINLGCGYDPLPWLFFGKRSDICQHATFVDVDYPRLMQKKVSIIQSTPQLSGLLQNFTIRDQQDGLLCRSENYAAVGCDLHNLDYLRFVLREQMNIDECKVAILFVAEVSIAYMDFQGSQEVLEWAASYDDATFCLLEQYLPDGRDHPFAETMLKHFEKLRTPLRAIGTLSDIRHRFIQAGWPAEGIRLQSLWDLWSDDGCISPGERRSLDYVEPFDEWEEFALFASHYFLLVATNSTRCRHAGDRGHHSPLLNVHTKSEPTIHCRPLDLPHTERRFAEVIPSPDDGQSFSLHGGLGTKGRLVDTTTFTTKLHAKTIEGPPLLKGLMCHTITPLSEHRDCLLVGGRESPSEASARCWLRSEGTWREVEPLPFGRYRHSAFAVRRDTGETGVVVMGGRSEDGRLLTDVLLWQKQLGWSKAVVSTTMPPARFGATALPDKDNGATGLWFGGIGDDRVVMQDVWQWHLVGNDISFTSIEDDEVRPPNISRAYQLCRFGAQVLNWPVNSGVLRRTLVGGIASTGILTRRDELLDLDDFSSSPIDGFRPLLVGMSLYEDLSLGGGATCFSFGTYWNPAVRFEVQDHRRTSPTWRLVTSTPARALPSPNTFADVDTKSRSISPVSATTLTSAAQFKQILAKRRPHVFKSCNIGECTSKWTLEYLKDKIGSEREVSVHVATTHKMDFQSKNFSYGKQKFGDFIDHVEQGELLYLRALSSTSPSSEPTKLNKDYANIADDFKLPPELDAIESSIHSSPLRISGRVTMWLHYDVMANILCQVRGRKRLLLFPPADVVQLGFAAGASSSSFDAFDQTALNEAMLKECQPFEVVLEPGDILLIPPLWLHTVAPSSDVSVAVNVFFRDLDRGYAAGRDVYGNRDLAAYEKGRKEVSKLSHSFADLPNEVARFYLERLAVELSSLARSR